MKIGIIGGKGLIGSFLAAFFSAKHFQVLVSDIKTKLSNKDLVKQCDVVIFSVPMHKTVPIIKSVLPYTRKDQLLMDVTSIKTPSINEMKKSRANVIGLHPMFRPSSLGLRNQTIVLCPVRTNKKERDMVKQWFTLEGAKIITMTPQKHDKLMSIIQVLVHFHAIVLGNTFRQLRISIPETLKIASPVYKLEMDMIGRIFSQSATLYGAIEMLNPETKNVTRQLILETTKLFNILMKKDMKQFEKEFKKTSKFLGDFKDHALAETNKLLTYIK